MTTREEQPGAAAGATSLRGDLLLTLVVALVYARSLTQGLVPSWDDGRFLIDNADVQHVSWGAFVRLVSGVHFQAWHPLHLLSYWIDVPLFGPSGPVQHTVNLLILLGALWLLRRVFVRLGLSPTAALVGALVVGIHPVQVEAVAWATGRKEVLALLFATLTLRAHLRSEGPWDASAWWSRLFFVLAALSKTTALPLPLVLLTLDLLLKRDTWRRALLRQLPSFALAAGLGALVIGIWQQHEMIRASAGASLPLMTLTHDLRLLLWPTPNALSPVHAIRRTPGLRPTDAIGILVLLALAAVAWRRRSRLGALSLAIFVLLLLPSANLVPLYFQVQDRYLSLPMLGAGLGFGLGFDSLRSGLGPASARALAALVILGLGASNVVYQGAWRSDEALWAHATRVEPEAFYAWLKRCEVERGAGHFDRAVSACEHAVAVEPELRIGMSALFLTEAARDERRRQLPAHAMQYGARFHRDIDRADALRDLAGEMVQAGYRDSALRALGRSLDLEPVSDERLEHAARVQLAAHQAWLTRFYLGRMSRPPILRVLKAFLALGEHPGSPPASMSPTPPSDTPPQQPR
ncbi:MAG: hypothetical protein GXP55_08690 [Deltaproteobacteria bacterium]|nr:hypothetical protein [Deltaproteobacteria bacterium]